MRTLGDYCTQGRMPGMGVLRSHGRRWQAIQDGEVHIDIAVIASQSSRFVRFTRSRRKSSASAAANLNDQERENAQSPSLNGLMARCWTQSVKFHEGQND